jgi:hypothetical protein
MGAAAAAGGSAPPPAAALQGKGSGEGRGTVTRGARAPSSSHPLPDSSTLSDTALYREHAPGSPAVQDACNFLDAHRAADAGLGVALSGGGKGSAPPPAPLTAAQASSPMALAHLGWTSLSIRFAAAAAAAAAASSGSAAAGTPSPSPSAGGVPQHGVSPATPAGELLEAEIFLLAVLLEGHASLSARDAGCSTHGYVALTRRLFGMLLAGACALGVGSWVEETLAGAIPPVAALGLAPPGAPLTAETERRRRAFGRLCLDALCTVVGLTGGGRGAEEEAAAAAPPSALLPAPTAAAAAAAAASSATAEAAATASAEEPLAAGIRAELKSFAGKAVLFAAGRALALVLGAEAAALAPPRDALLPAVLVADALHVAQVLRALLLDRRAGPRGSSPQPALLPFILGLQDSAQAGQDGASDRLSTPVLLRYGFRVAAGGAASASGLVRVACALLARGLGDKAFQALCR